MVLFVAHIVAQLVNIYHHMCRWVRASGNVVFMSEHDSGGHFAAYEKPTELAEDVRKMFGKGGPAFGVVSGKTGYSNL